MGLSSALFSSVSGLDITSTAISVIGDNIANVSTPGFKARRADFADVLGQSISTVAGFSQVGAGASLNRVSSIYSQGTLESTQRGTDLAIEGRGFFVLEGGGRFYSRAGAFTIDNQGTLVNPEGLRVQGFGVDPATGVPTGALQDIVISTAVSAPRESTQLDMSVNLEPLTGGVFSPPFDPTDPANTSQHQTTVTLYDTLGQGHPATFFFTNTGPNAWEWNATLPPADTTIAPVPGANHVVQGSGTLTFDNTGALTAVAGSPVTFAYTGGVAPLNSTVAIDFGPVAGVGTGDPTTQFAGTSSTTNSFFQDGFSAGTLQSVIIDREGFISGQFSNGEVTPLAQVALANFPNLEALVNVGNNNVIESRDSGQPLIGGPRTGSFGSIRSNSLEQSNVDLAEQFVKLIINQRSFQANTRTVSVTNELLANLVSLGQ